MTDLVIALVYPELLGTYGDGGNAEVLRSRAALRGLDAAVLDVPAGDRVPTGADLYVLGGGEDEPQGLAAAALQTGALLEAVHDGAAVLAVCAGLQILGASFGGRAGDDLPGLGLLPLTTQSPGPAGRSVGDLAVAPSPAARAWAGAWDQRLPTLVGYENHGGRTVAEPGAGDPLGSVLRGVGNGTDSAAAPARGAPDAAVDGWCGRRGAGWVIATYLHGPVLAQNPVLADALLAEALGDTLPDWMDDEGRVVHRAAERLHQSRLAQLGLT